VADVITNFLDGKTSNYNVQNHYRKPYELKNRNKSSNKDFVVK